MIAFPNHEIELPIPQPNAALYNSWALLDRNAIEQLAAKTILFIPLAG